MPHRLLLFHNVSRLGVTITLRMSGERESSALWRKRCKRERGADGAKQAQRTNTLKRKPNIPAGMLGFGEFVYAARLQRCRSSAGLLGCCALAQVAAQLAERVRLDLPDSLRGHAILVRQLV
jgi:hypothetical protein